VCKQDLPVNLEDRAGGQMPEAGLRQGA
jgi:hypothetical protein